MKRNNRTGSHLFFIEFIIVLFFFLIVSTVCLRLFARAHGITQRADALSHAQATAASVAAVVEDILSETDMENLLSTAAEYFSGASLSTLPYDSSDQEGLVIFYDKEFKVCTADDARYMLSATIDQGEQKETLLISVYNYDHVSIYDLSVSLHRPMTRKEALQ